MMKDVLAGLLIFLIVLLMFVVTAERPPEGKLEQVICANITCYYEVQNK